MEMRLIKKNRINEWYYSLIAGGFALVVLPVCAQTVRIVPPEANTNTSKTITIPAPVKTDTPPPAPVAPPAIKPEDDGEWLVFDAPDNTLMLSRSSVRIYKSGLDGKDVYYAYVLKKYDPALKLPKLKQPVATQSLGLSFVCEYQAMMVVSEELLDKGLSVLKKYRSSDFPLSHEMRAVTSVPGLNRVKNYLCQTKDWPIIEVNNP